MFVTTIKNTLNLGSKLRLSTNLLNNNCNTGLNIRGYKRNAPNKNDLTKEDVDLRSNQDKILERYHIPRILDQNDPQHKELFGPYIKGALERLEEKENIRVKNGGEVYKGSFKDQYKLTSAVIIERYPVIEPEPTEYEKKYYQTIDELSMLRDREPIDIIRLTEDLPEFKGDMKDSKDTSVQKKSADEFEEDFDKFVPEPRVTEADKNDNRQSLERKLDKSLYLIIKKAGSRYTWQFPSTNHIQGESIRNTAERALRDSCGADWSFWIPSQAPCGLYKYDIEKELQDILKVQGIKEFFFRAHLYGGQPQFNPSIVKDHLWVSKAELVEYFDKEYYDSVIQLIYDDCYYAHIIEE